ncbi:MAG: BrnA antitoxin family protein [Gammaproteobacteria bacterium]|nr:BrnA antitoxin family protein [Gammaproteobacteria bacterium]MDE0479505.1 BrnA antitoxin family protein [Gammaproteobacteria bacterium]MYA66753.1 BrnA antitoxin family protein [Gammaproteobacteria bacterium]MYC59900.1 BrnA antitoxin family protein [Gammaproteobacteria bacterium]MYH47421.1 BrnA antitoxin family protein [Gammaproteobacteria bacterium]
MRKEYDFGGARRGAPAAQKGKSRITILLDKDILEAFRGRAKSGGRGYQTAINQALREYLEREHLESALRRVLREELEEGALSGLAG